MASAIRIAAPFEELSHDEYQIIYNRLQDTLTRLGYSRMTESEVNSTIISGKFVRGGNEWIFQPDFGEFHRVEISETEYKYRLDALLDVLSQLGIQKTSEEHRQIINRGNFYFQGHRYEFDTASGRFLRIELSEAEYRERVRRLQEQLQKIGYGQMTESECRATINSGIFYFGGFEWVYNHESGWYEMGAKSDKEHGIVDNNVFSNIGLDLTNYTSTNPEDDRKPLEPVTPNQNKPGCPLKVEVSKDRGDQPPQAIGCESDEVTEPLPRPSPVTRPTPVQPPPNPPYIAPPLATLVVPSQQTEFESRYHRKQTTYTQHTSGVVRIRL